LGGLRAEIVAIKDADMPCRYFIAWQTSRFTPAFNSDILIRSGSA